MKRIAAVLLVLTLMATSLFCLTANAEIGDLIRFLPTEIEVQEDKVVVEGYFVNLNQDITVKNFTDFEMAVYLSGDLLVEGEFGEINEFSIKSMGTKYQSFTFNGPHELNEGIYTCDDSFYVTFACSFLYVD